MKKGIIFILFLITAFLLSRCGIGQENSIDKDSLKIALKWFPAYPEENKYKVETGLKWILAYLGANDLESQYQNSIQWKGDNVLDLDLNKLGYSNNAKTAFQKILIKLKERETYKSEGWIDVGLFVSQTFNNTWSYYAITGVQPTYKDFKNKYNFDDRYDFAIRPGESCVAPGFRFINRAKADTVPQIAYIAKEGLGNTVDSFVEKEFEVFDFMPNGQPRFAIYSLDGELLGGADKEVTTAGKPAKCMWCHTSKLPRLLFAKTETKGYGKLKQFSKILKRQNNQLRKYWRDTNQNFVADSIRQHSLAELLYVTYEDPTLYRLRSEGISESKIEQIKSMTHQNEEYIFYHKLVLDSVVARSKVFPEFNITTRETNLDEINLLR